jgi:tripartite ATP-independent transporter DctM subunit
MNRIWSLIERTLGLVAIAALAALVLLPSWQVILRDFFNAPLIGLEEATRWGLIILVFLAAPLLLSTNEQIRLAEFINYLPATPRKLLERVILLVSGISVGIIAYAGVLSVMRNMSTRTSTLDIPFWLFAAPMLIGFAAAALGYVWFALRRDDPPLGGGHAALGPRGAMDLGFAVLLAFFVLFVLGFPVVFAILIPSIAYIAWSGVPLATVAQRVLYALDSFPAGRRPVFILVGNLMNAAGITEKIYHFANVLGGRLPGGLAQVNIIGSLIFSGVSGAALADVGGIGRIEIKAMKDEGFPVPFAAALTGASAIVGPIFPPSIPVIIYAAATSISAIQLLVAGIIPALVCVAMLMVATAIVSQRRGYPRSSRWPTFRELWDSFWPASPALFAPVVLVGGMLSGYFTPTEASAVCVAYILLIGIAFYREMSWGFIYRAAVETVRTSAAVLIIVGAAAMFGWILAVEQVPQEFSAWFKDLTTNPLMMLLIVNIIFFIAGMFIDSTTATLLLVPIVAPPVVAAGVDPIHLGMVVIFNLMIGTITPPFGCRCSCCRA